MQLDALWATLILAGMCGLMYWAARLARRRLGIGAGTIGPDALKVVGKRQLDPKKAIYVVEIGERYVLLGAAEGSVSMLDHVTPEEFASMLPEDDGVAQKVRRLTSTAGSASDGEPGDEQRDSGDADAQQFMTPKESFRHLMAKARDARAGRRASGD